MLASNPSSQLGSDYRPLGNPPRFNPIGFGSNVLDGPPQFAIDRPVAEREGFELIG